jgi:hypothetical protein
MQTYGKSPSEHRHPMPRSFTLPMAYGNQLIVVSARERSRQQDTDFSNADPILSRSPVNTGHLGQGCESTSPDLPIPLHGLPGWRRASAHRPRPTIPMDQLSDENNKADRGHSRVGLERTYARPQESRQVAAHLAPFLAKFLRETAHLEPGSSSCSDRR